MASGPPGWFGIRSSTTTPKYDSLWKDNFIDVMQTSTRKVTWKQDGNAVVVTVSRIAPPVRAFGMRVSSSCRASSGRVDLKVSGEPYGDYSDIIPRIGISFGFPVAIAPSSGMATARARTIRTRCAPARSVITALRSTTCSRPYVMPQDCANREGTRWVALRSSHGDGLVVTRPASDAASIRSRSPHGPIAARLSITPSMSTMLVKGDTVTVNINDQLLGLGRTLGVPRCSIPIAPVLRASALRCPCDR